MKRNCIISLENISILYYDQCIIDYFNTNPSINDLDSLPIYKATVEVRKEISNAARFLIGSREERSRYIRDVDLKRFFNIKEVLIPTVDDSGKKKRVFGIELLNLI